MRRADPMAVPDWMEPMTKVDQLLEGLPEDVVRWTRERLAQLPGPARRKAEELLGKLSSMPNPAVRILRDIHRSALGAFDQERVTVAIVGPVNAGKSTLVNALTASNEAAVSPVPGTTVANQAVRTGPFVVVDTPGADDALHAERRAQALAAASAADLVVALFDCSVGINRSALELYREIVALGRPTVVALNKVDLLRPKEEAAALDAARRTLGVDLLPISAERGRNVGQLLKVMVAADQRVLNLMSDMLPRYRRSIAWSRVASASVVAAGIGWEPLPIADVIPLTLLQAVMVIEVGKCYGAPPSFRMARELIATAAGGLALRQGFQQIAKAVPGIGNAASAAYAAAGTAALGWVAILWFESGQTLTRDELRQAYRDALPKVRRALRARKALPDSPELLGLRALMAATRADPEEEG